MGQAYEEEVGPDARSLARGARVGQQGGFRTFRKSLARAREGISERLPHAAAHHRPRPSREGIGQ